MFLAGVLALLLSRPAELDKTVKVAKPLRDSNQCTNAFSTEFNREIPSDIVQRM